MKRFLLLFAALSGAFALAAQQQRPPLYLVNGKEWPAEEIGTIDASELEKVDVLPADEETIARYGEKASGGVICITLRYDSPAVFSDSLTFDRYIARHVKWDDDDPAARVSLRCKITAEGRAVVSEVLESTDNRLKRRVLKAVAEAPLWTPARKEGAPVETTQTFTVRLPKGKALPGEPYIRIR